MSSFSWRNVWSVALAEAGAILKSPGFIMTALAPFAIAVLGVIALVYLSTNDPRRVLAVSSNDTAVTESVIERLNQSIGPHASKSNLRGASAGHWWPISTTANVGDLLEIDEERILVGAAVYVDHEAALVRIQLGPDFPGYLSDLVRLEANHALFAHHAGQEIVHDLQQASIQSAPQKTLDEQLIWLLTVLMATAAGALAAASTHALTTAFLESGSERKSEDVHFREDFLGKLIGIGGAYSTLALPWGLILGCGLAVLTVTGDPALVEAIRKVSISTLDPIRLILFFICVPAGYTLFASLALIMAMRSKTAASARSFTGPMSFLAIAPAPIALAFSANMDGSMFTVLSWFPITATASIQLGFGTLNTFDLFIRALFLCFVALAALQWGMRRREMFAYK